MCPCISGFRQLAPRCSCALLHNLQVTSDRCLIFASHLANGMIPAIAIISRLLCFQETRGSFKYFPRNVLLSFCRNMKSAVHVPCAGWVIDIALLCPSLHTWFQEFSVINPSVLLQDLHHALVRCLISLLVCANLYVIIFTPFFISSPECAFLSPSTCKPLFIFAPHSLLPIFVLHPHDSIKCRMTILMTDYFPCLAARGIPCEDCSIRLLAPLFAYLRIWNSLICQNVGSLIRCFSSMRFHFIRKIHSLNSNFLLITKVI